MKKISWQILLNEIVVRNGCLLFVNIFIMNYLFAPAIYSKMNDRSSHSTDIFLGVLVELLVIFFAILITRKSIAYLRIYTNGISTKGVMTDVEKTNKSDSLDHSCIVTFEYKTFEGATNKLTSVFDDDCDIPSKWRNYMTYKNKKYYEKETPFYNGIIASVAGENDEEKKEMQNELQETVDIIDGNIIPEPPNAKIVYMKVKNKYIAELAIELDKKYKLIADELIYKKGHGFFDLNFFICFIIILINISIFYIRYGIQNFLFSNTLIDCFSIVFSKINLEADSISAFLKFVIILNYD